MHQLTLYLFYVVKYAELILLIIGTVLIISGIAKIVDQIRSQAVTTDKDMSLLIMSIVSGVLVTFHLFYNNLLINLRFYCKTRCVTFGLCMYDGINCAICHCFLFKPCRDRCCTIWTTIKWVIYGIIMGVTIHLLKEYERSILEDRFYFPELLVDLEKSHLDLYLILFLLQYPIFVVARIPIFFLYTILTCCCDKGEYHSDDAQKEHTVIHLDFIPYELGQLNNFENHLVGHNELQYIRRLSFVRDETMR